MKRPLDQPNCKRRAKKVFLPSSQLLLSLMDHMIYLKFNIWSPLATAKSSGSITSNFKNVITRLIHVDHLFLQ